MEVEYKTKSERREKKKRKRIPKHGAGFGNIYKNAVLKRLGSIKDNEVER